MDRSGGGKYRLHFLDGLRALAAVYVLLSHVVSVKLAGEPSAAMRMVIACLLEGHISVVFFIVLSGFSLMLPVARAGSTAVAGGLRHYLYRRARRILPPYYAALVLSIATIVVFNAAGARLGFGRGIYGAVTTGSIVSHLLLVHNFQTDWAFRLNMPMWSIATEWQIYFLLPLLLLPLLARTNAVTMVVAAWVLGSLPGLLRLGGSDLYFACPWLVGSFALGMWGALIGFSPAYRQSWLCQRAPWGTGAIASLVLLVGPDVCGFDLKLPYPVIDLETSLFAFCFINAGVQRSRSRPEKSDWLLGFLSSRALVFVSGFSYSLYLIQYPLLRLTERLFRKLPLSFDAGMFVHLVIVTPAVMGAAWLFAEVFEKPFTGGTGVLQSRAVPVCDKSLT